MKLLVLITYLMIAILGGFLGGTIAYLLYFNRPKMPHLDEEEINKRIDEISKRINL